MARFNAQNAEKYGGNGSGGYFSLSDDGDVARVRILYNDINDLVGLSVHEVEVDGRRRYVNCPREYDSPIDDCPFCAEHQKQFAKVYIPLLVLDPEGKNDTEGEVKLWERGKRFISKIASLCSRYPNLCSHIFEIERQGKKGDTNTTYELYEVGQDDAILEDLPEVPDVLGTVILDKTAEEMEYYLDNGEFPEDEQADEKPSRRREEPTRPQRRERTTEIPSRRTPARRGTGRRSDAF